MNSVPTSHLLNVGAFALQLQLAAAYYGSTRWRSCCSCCPHRAGACELPSSCHACMPAQHTAAARPYCLAPALTPTPTPLHHARTPHSLPSLHRAHTQPTLKWVHSQAALVPLLFFCPDHALFCSTPPAPSFAPRTHAAHHGQRELLPTEGPAASGARASQAAPWQAAGRAPGPRVKAPGQQQGGGGQGGR